MLGLQLVSMMYFHARLSPAVNISDHSDGLRSGMQYINCVNTDEAEEEEEVETPHLSDWAHIVTNMTRGKMLPKSNPYYGQMFHYLRAIHFAQSTEQMNLLIDALTYAFHMLAMRMHMHTNAQLTVLHAGE